MDTIHAERTGASTTTLLLGDTVFLRLEGVRARTWADVNLGLRGRYLLSRFSYVRWFDQPVLASVYHRARAVLADPRAVAMVAAFGAPSTVRDVCAGVPGLDRDVAETAVGLLAGAGLLDSVPDGADSADDAGSRGDAAAGWSFADLLFRTAGESDGRPDATRSAEPPPGAVTASPHGEYLGLARWTPREGRVLDVDALLDRRTSVRTYGEVPLSRADLGAFLDLAQTPQDTGLLEPAVVVRACTGLPSGLYRYRRASHALTTLAPWSPELDRLAGDATRSVDGTSSPVQVLVVLFASGLTAGTYADVLVEVGRRMQQMYLAAAMLGLAGCALGAGDSGAFARASGLDPLTHPSVGEFLLGSKAEETT